MNNEIKEILDYFQKDVDKYEESKKYLIQKYGYEEEAIDNISQHKRHIYTKKLLDYIANLQEIEKEHKNCTRKHWQQKCAEHCANEMIYKSKIDKLINYLDNTTPFDMNSPVGIVKKDLLNILNKGSEKE